MSDVVDLTLLSDLLQGIERDVRLLQLQVDNLASAHGTLEQRLEAVDAGLTALLAELSDSTTRITEAIRAESR